MIIYFCTCQAMTYNDDDCLEHGGFPHWERHLDEYGQSYYTEIVTKNYPETLDPPTDT